VCGANQKPLIEQEFPRNVVQAASGMWTNIEPGGKFFAVAMDDDRGVFAVDDRVERGQSRLRQLGPIN